MPGKEKGPCETPKTSVNTFIDVKNLPLYEEVAAKTGYTVSIIAREGEPFTFRRNKYTRISDHSERDYYHNEKYQEKVQDTIMLKHDEIAISIIRPQDQQDHSPFWKAFDALKPTPADEQKG